MTKLEIQSNTKPFTIIKNAIIDSENILNEHEKILYIVLLRYGNKAFPSLSTLSKKCGFSKSTAQRTIDSLISKGLLKKKNRINKKNGNTSNIYILFDDDKIWESSNKNIKEIIDEVTENQMIAELTARGYIINKEKEPTSAPTKVTDVSTQSKFFSQPDNTIDFQESQDLEKYTLNQIKELFSYEAMIYDYPDEQEHIDSVMDILHTTLNTSKKTIRIAGTDKPAMVVIGKLMKLDNESILYAIRKYKEQTERIKNPTAYMLTILYMAPEQFQLDITNQVQHDFF
ncbi:MAG: helix-turn-helix domain-containing protein [Clostridia bacterium]